MRLKSGAAALKIRDFDLELKSEADGYKLTGYGSVWGTVDSYREVVEKGAFAESLAALKAKGRKLPMLWQHRSGEPIGVWDVLKEDDRGLYLEGTLLKGVQAAEEAKIRAAAGAVTGLSIGYYVREDSYDQVEKVRTLKRLDLVETSLVTFPANDDARVEAVKFQIINGGLPSLKDFEGFLRREAGLSKTQAAAVVSRGYAHLFRSESGEDEETTNTPGAKEAAQAVSGLFAQLRRPILEK